MRCMSYALVLIDVCLGNLARGLMWHSRRQHEAVNCEGKRAFCSCHHLNLGHEPDKESHSPITVKEGADWSPTPLRLPPLKKVKFDSLLRLQLIDFRIEMLWFLASGFFSEQRHDFSFTLGIR